MYEPQHLKRWTLPENYYGAIWPDYFGAGGLRVHAGGALGESDTVIVVRESHWRVGWVEWIATTRTMTRRSRSPI
jgi:hypothetical protein